VCPAVSEVRITHHVRQVLQSSGHNFIAPFPPIKVGWGNRTLFGATRTVRFKVWVRRLLNFRVSPGLFLVVVALLKRVWAALCLQANGRFLVRTSSDRLA
jgi:hypothetical protein